MDIRENSNYEDLIRKVFEVIEITKVKVYKSLTKSHLMLNFEIGKHIVESQTLNGWGKSIVDKLSNDIRKMTDSPKGYSPQNLWRMRQFYLEYKDKPNLLELAIQVPWGQNILILNKIKSDSEKEYYLDSTIKMAWSRAVLLNQIKANAYSHQKLESKLNNFEITLPKHLSEQVSDAMKSEYNLDFLGITKPVLERELENRLIENIKDLLMELGYGFCLVGHQYRLKLNEKEYYIDLLFYHRILKCLVAIDLKVVEFTPEFTGKMNFYLELIDSQIKQPDDNPSIGIILCPEKDDIAVEYALRTSNKPIGVSEYRLTNELPEKLKGKIPTKEEFKKLLEKSKKIKEE